MSDNRKHLLELSSDELAFLHDALISKIDANRKRGLSDHGPESDPLFKIMWRKTDIQKERELAAKRVQLAKLKAELGEK